jgi:DNA-binding NarL/FixJ family response regulator
MTATLREGCGDTANKANFPRMGNRARVGMIKVLLADDDRPFIEALSPLIERQPDLAVVGKAFDGLAAIELAEELAPDAVVIDLHMPRLDGVTAVARLRRDHPSMCVIALTGDEAPALHKAVTEAGADAVLVKDEFVDVLVDRLAAAKAKAS